MSLDSTVVTRNPCVVKFHPEKITYNLGNKFQNVWLSAMKGNIEEVARVRSFTKLLIESSLQMKDL